MDTIELHQDFKEFLRLLDSAKIEYLLIGGYAVGYHGYPRATGDLDLWVGISDANSAALSAVLRKFGFSEASVPASLFLTEHQIIRIGFPPVRIDLTTSVTGLD